MIVNDARPWPDRMLAYLDGSPDSTLATVLSGPAALWVAGARLKRLVQPDVALPGRVPTLGIGNLRVGGSGKTPVVEDLGVRLAAEGERVAVLTRGYRADTGGDEPGWLEGAGLHVFADADRRRGLARAEAAGATRILLDDALQTRHRPRWTVAIVLERDLARPPRALPAGPAREGSEGLDRADAILVRREGVDGGNLDGRRLGFRLSASSLTDSAGVVADPPAGRPLLLSGLARPESFEADAMRFGVDPAGSWREADHWAPRDDSAERIGSFAKRCGAAWVLVPEKNLERATSIPLDLPVRALSSRIEWDEGADPLHWLRGRGIGI
jgi:tetraacyldisaccharide 4'-kinase